MRVLGIETSCDETAASVVERARGDGNGNILSNVIYSQVDEHALYGGIVPEIASRAHLSKLDFILEKALDEAKVKLSEMDAIAVTAGPGLIGGLITGLMTAKALSTVTGIPYYAINHLEGHALTARLTHGIEFPFLLLLVSGGHTQFIEVRGVADYLRLATTIDDALGEAFDKVAKLLSLGHPGGPYVEKTAGSGNPKRFAFPRPLNAKSDLNFSFSGLKTAVRKAAVENAPLNDRDVADICASFQAAIIDVLVDRTEKMIADFETRNPQVAAKNTPKKHLVVAGGVAANKDIGYALEKCCIKNGWTLITPPLELCGDNAAMIAWAGLERIGKVNPSDMQVAPRSRWPLDEKSQSLVGSGRRGAKV